MSRNFNSSKLVRLLGDSASLDIDASKQDFAEKLGLWLSAGDTVTLHAALQSIKTGARETPAADSASAMFSEVEFQFQQVIGALTKGIASSSASIAASSSTGQAAKGTPSPEGADKTWADYAPFHKRYLDQQRQMELKIGPLRAHVRQALTKVSPQLTQLAALDAILEKAISGREQRLLSTVPAFLEKRFQHLQKQTQHGIDAFAKEWQEVLLAELDVRLQPVLGLIEAFSNEVKKHQ